MRDGKMKAQVLVAPRKVEVREVPVPEPAQGELLLRVETCAVTNRDLEAFVDGPPDGNPIILGSQLCGEIIEIGPGVENLRVGQRVAPAAAVARSVSWCYSGPSREKGGTWADDAPPYGGFARYVKLPASSCAPVPDLIDNYDGAMIASLAGAVSAWTDMCAPLGSACVIYGEQPVCTALARAVAFAPVIALSNDEGYLKTARKLGANYALKADEEGIAEAKELIADIPDRVMLTDPTSMEDVGAGFDWCHWSAVQTSNEPDRSAWDSALRLVAYGRIDLRPAYSLAVPLADLGWALEQSLSDPTLTKVFAAPVLTERVYFESQRKPFEGTITPG